MLITNRSMPYALLCGAFTFTSPCASAHASPEDAGGFQALTQNELRTAEPAPVATRSISYSTGGFETFALGSIHGQDGWITDVDQTRFQVVAGAGVGGTNAVQVHASGPSNAVDWTHPNPSPVTPGANEVITVSTDFARTLDPAGSFSSSRAYMVDVRNTSYQTTFRFGLTVDNNNAPAIGVTSRWNPELGFDPAAPATSVIISNSLDQNTFYNLEARANYETKTFDLYNNGNLFWADLPFADQSATTFRHAALAYERGPSPSVEDYGLFDNYAVSVSPTCPVDFDQDGDYDLDDLDAFITAFIGGESLADLDANGSLNLDDLDAFVSAFMAGCG